MKNKRLKKFLGWSALAIVAGLVLYSFIVDPLLNYVYLKRDSTYTISSDVSIGPPSRSGNESKYTFYLNGRWYAGFTTLPLKTDGTKYFIKFYPKNPKWNQATTVKASPDDIKNMPPGGYKKLPHE